MNNNKSSDCGSFYVSIVIPIFNAGKTIAGCLESVIGQSYPPNRYEVIAVDNGSTDNSAAIINKYPVEYMSYCQMRGSYAARNAGLEHAIGELIAFTDSDCIADKEWLKKGVECFNDDSIGCVAGDIRGYEPSNYIEQYLNERHFLSPTVSSKFFGFLPFAQTANAFYRRDVFNRVGYFKERWVSGGDADLCWRMQLQTGYKVRFTDYSVVYHKQRSTIIDMFRQGVKNGEGNVLLYKNYSSVLKNTSIAQKISVLFNLLVSIVPIVAFALRQKRRMSVKARNRYLDIITFAAREIGRVKGSLKNGVLYL